MSKKPHERSSDNDLSKHRLNEESHLNKNQDKNEDDSYHLSDSETFSDDVTQPSAKLKDSADLLGANHWRTEAEKFKNEYLYLMADFENYKKNVIKERSDLRKYGSERLIVEILGGLDLLDKALDSKVTADNIESFRKGVELTSSQFKTMLQKFGVEELPAKGAAFDPTMHEALSSEETEEVPAGHVSQVYRKPYKLHDRVVRPGQVVVARAPSDTKSE